MRIHGRWLGSMLAVIALASTGHATRLRLDRVAATSQGFLYVEFELESPFEGMVEDAVRSGLPTTLNYTIEVWQHRNGWWDKLEGAYERRFRILRDLLNDLYYVVTPEQTSRFTHLDSLVAVVGKVARGSANEPAYFGRALFDDNRTYYVVVTARLAPLTVEDLNELDEWLRGTFTGRDDEAGGLSGLTRTMGGLLMSMTGFGDRQLKTRSQSFKPAEVPREPQPPPVAPIRPAVPGRARAAPDSNASP
ncbi:MAG TPA: DUF4390 domain-containing protein [Candidatus Krumholzibacteria bacterium]|jgi:hypothetical protein|nr:DUF4390 domain-containing protein [Candidatus Krumholzibacteria bacterium]